ncbi:MmgE/PrpD family protein [Geodermatophilus sp. DF01-2]|uniref:MmgE/PrpD family protein n=1 Tax=Geodermatophilus sp. DF01-2 TaxID=2559610 RepID=UPI0010732D85|nr:MmgE/PrpD family protein [Geodermatophilus sp. DF01_2]TFV64727.1 MmgE/PrpD family protein [Geodermatophilus sp. DF01_2]
MSGAPTAGERIAEHVVSVDPADTTAETVHAVARAFLDTFAVAVAATGDPVDVALTGYVAGSTGPASVWAGTGSLPPEHAALVNGAVGHVLDYDDVTSPLRGHPSIALLPALVAAAEAGGADGRRLSAAYAVGFEVICKLSKACALDHYARGWHSTSTIGLLGATAAVAHLTGLGRDAVRDALGLAVAQAAGTRQNFGTMAKSFQAGSCGAAALRSVALAGAGMTASAEALDGGTGGFLRLYSTPEAAAALDAELATLGQGPGELVTSGIDVKKYPLCYATHRTIDLLLDLRAEHGLTLADVDRVEMRANRGGLAPLLHDRPTTGLEAKFSMQFAVAAALLDGEVKLRSFDDEQVRRPEIQGFLPRVTPTEDDGPPFPRFAEVTLHLADGRTVGRRTHALRGSADTPLSDDELLEKVADCLGRGGLGERVKPFADAVFGWADRPVRSVLARRLS